VTVLLAVLGMAACSEVARVPDSRSVGPNPTLPEPVPEWLPTVRIPKAIGWAFGAMPTPAASLRVAAFAKDLDHPRWLFELPNGDILVAQSDAPPRPGNARGLKGHITTLLMKRAGAGQVSCDCITLLRDADGDGVAELRSALITGLHSPFGIALVGNALYVANTDALVRFEYREGMTHITAQGQRVAELPAGPINHHWTKNIIASPDGKRIFVTVGSNSNVGENGLEAEAQRAAILEVTLATGATRTYASGLRNPNGMAFVADSEALWVVVNERDELGSDLVPDYLTRVIEGGHYGWPHFYYGEHRDPRLSAEGASSAGRNITPDYALGNHVAALGLAYARPEQGPQGLEEGMFIGEHGSWNRRPISGYKVVFVPFREGRPAGMPLDILTGFVNEDGEARGRPVGVIVTHQGALLVADDVGDTVWRVTREATTPH